MSSESTSSRSVRLSSALSLERALSLRREVSDPSKRETLTDPYSSDARFLQSKSLSLPTQFNVFLPEGSISAKAEKAPVLYYLAGLTCNEDTG